MYKADPGVILISTFSFFGSIGLGVWDLIYNKSYEGLES